jgi:predicted S18 family serine protease
MRGEQDISVQGTFYKGCLTIRYNSTARQKNAISIYMKVLKLALPILILLTGACASTNPPTQQLTETETVIRQADQVGAGNYAPLEIREARQKLEKARLAYNEEEYDEAARLAEQAKVDAELAQIMTLSAKAQLAVRELRESIRLLQEELSERDK